MPQRTQALKPAGFDIAQEGQLCIAVNIGTWEDSLSTAADNSIDTARHRCDTPPDRRCPPVGARQEATTVKYGAENRNRIAHQRCPIARSFRATDVVAVSLPATVYTGIWATLTMNKGETAGG